MGLLCALLLLASAALAVDDAATLYEQGRFAEGEVLIRRMIDDDLANEEDVGTVNSRRAFHGLFLKELGRYDQARAVLEPIVVYYEETGEPFRLAAALNNLGQVLQIQGDFVGARELFERSLKIRREHGPPDEVARALNNLAYLLQEQGELDAAAAMYRESLQRWRELVGEHHVEVALAHNNAGHVELIRGDYSAAKTSFTKSVRIWREVSPEHPSLATSLGNLAVAAMNTGDFEASRILFEETLAIIETTLGTDHLMAGRAQNNLGNLLQAQGDLLGARKRLLRSLEIHQALGPDHYGVASVVNNLGLVAAKAKDIETAVPLFERALAIHRAKPGRDVEHAVTLNNISSALLQQGKFALAISTAQESIDVATTSVGPNHPVVANALLQLARGQRELGRTADAVATLERAVEIAGTSPRKSVLSSVLSALAVTRHANGDDSQVLDLYDEALRHDQEQLDLIDALSEREALAFVPQLRHSLDPWLRLQPDVEIAWSQVIRVKGIVAARARDARAAAVTDPESAAIAQELANARKHLAQLQLSGGPPEEIAQLASAGERLERDLLKRSAIHRKTWAQADASPAEICAALPAGAALVDFFRYEREEDVQHYLAFIAIAGDCRFRRVDLGPALPIEEAVASWRATLVDSKQIASRVDSRGERLTELIWTPIGAEIGEVSQVLVVPDSALAAVPLAALPIGDGRYLLEDLAITYLDRAADILERREPIGDLGRALVIGGIDHGAGEVSGQSGFGGALAPCNNRNWEHLPGALAEAEALTRRWNRSHKDAPSIYLTGSDATESTVAANLSGKALVHFATHGFFATGQCRSALDGDGGFNPMLLSGLVLAGANRAADPLADTDGILTAAEVSGLDLRGTHLVVLSGCETGLGEIESGQGILGLRRAFSVAGAHSLIMTLWAVGDEETAMLMEDLYKHYLHQRRPLPASDALRTAQLEMLRRQRADGDVRPASWAAFVAAGDWR